MTPSPSTNTNEQESRKTGMKTYHSRYSVILSEAKDQCNRLAARVKIFGLSAVNSNIRGK
jgi:hypothetical protein